MRVFIDGIIFGRQRFGGISRVWEEYLTRLPDYNVDLKLLIPFRRQNLSLIRLLQHKDKYEIIQDYLYWPSRYFERVSVRSKILEWLYINHSVNIFHSTYFSTIYDKRIRKVVTVHDMIPEKFENENQSKWTSFIINMKREVVKNADKVITDTHNTKKDVLETYPWIPEGKVSVIHIALPNLIGNTQVSFEDIVKKYSLRVRPLEYFLYVGHKRGYKNFQIIIDVVEKNNYFRDWVFICVGGDRNDSIEVLQDKFSSEKFIFIEFVRDDELAVLYRNALALIYPSLYEGFGLPILEAMAHHCPVVCSNTSCFPEVAGEAAIYFDPYSVDSLAAALTNLLCCNREEIIAKGLRNVARFSWKESTKALVDIYSSLL